MMQLQVREPAHPGDINKGTEAQIVVELLKADTGARGVAKLRPGGRHSMSRHRTVFGAQRAGRQI